MLPIILTVFNERNYCIIKKRIVKFKLMAVDGRFNSFLFIFILDKWI
jgi:hypothetical protein